MCFCIVNRVPRTPTLCSDPRDLGPTVSKSGYGPWSGTRPLCRHERTFNKDRSFGRSLPSISEYLVTYIKRHYLRHDSLGETLGVWGYYWKLFGSSLVDHVIKSPTKNG